MSLKGLKVLITAGPTREMWDDVRFISNLSSGQTGAEIAKEALRRDADVTVISGVPGLDTGTAKTVNVVSAVDMYEAVEEHIGRSDIFIAAAAVADFRPVKQSGKIRKDSAEPVIRLERNPDILKWVGNNYPSKIKVGFSLQEEPGSDDGAVKMKEKNCDNCKYLNGNRRAQKRVETARKALAAVGTDSDAVKIKFLSSLDAHKLISILEELG